MAWQAWQAWRRSEETGTVALGTAGEVWCGGAGSGVETQASHVVAGHGETRLDRLGDEGSRMARPGTTRQAWTRSQRLGESRLGASRQDWTGTATQRRDWRGRQGNAATGVDELGGQDTAAIGIARHGKAGQGR